MAATWENGDNYRIYPDVPADLEGSFAGRPVELHATFHLDPATSSARARSSPGTSGPRISMPLWRGLPAGWAAPGRSPLTGRSAAPSSPSTPASTGRSHTPGQIRGTVAGTPIRIDAARTRDPHGGQTRPHRQLPGAPGAARAGHRSAPALHLTAGQQARRARRPILPQQRRSVPIPNEDRLVVPDTLGTTIKLSFLEGPARLAQRTTASGAAAVIYMWLETTARVVTCLGVLGPPVLWSGRPAPLRCRQRRAGRPTFRF